MDSETIVIDRYWLRGYVANLKSEAEQLTAIIMHLSAAGRWIDSSQRQIYYNAVEKLECLRREVFIIAELLEQYDADAAYEARIFEMLLRDIQLPQELR